MDPFVHSITRYGIYTGWRDRRHAIADIVSIASEWVDGSFVTAKQNPSDVDVVTVLDGAEVEALPPAALARLDDLFNHARVKLRYGCDGYFLATRPIGHPLRQLFEQQVRYWDRWWSHQRDGSMKGYLVVEGQA